MLSALVTLLVITPVASAAPVPKDAKPPVSLEVTVTPSSSGRWGTTLRVRLVGEAAGVSVLTEGLTAKVTQDGRTATIAVSLPEARDHKGRLIVPSATALGIVTLNPDEVAAVDVPNSSQLQQAIKDAADGKVDLTVEYEVATGWAKRFGVAAGKLRASAVVAKADDKKRAEPKTDK